MPNLEFHDDSKVDQPLFFLRVQNCQYSLPTTKINVARSAFKP